LWDPDVEDPGGLGQGFRRARITVSIIFKLITGAILTTNRSHIFIGIKVTIVGVSASADAFVAESGIIRIGDIVYL
jgi:hypothetical protein